jgi:hypothetical protein
MAENQIKKCLIHVLYTEGWRKAEASDTYKRKGNFEFFLPKKTRELSKDYCLLYSDTV